MDQIAGNPQKKNLPCLAVEAFIVSVCLQLKWLSLSLLSSKGKGVDLWGGRGSSQIATSKLPTENISISDRMDDLLKDSIR